jgi:hypothetical protein
MDKERIKRVQEMMNSTWDYIGDDALHAILEDGKRNSIKRSEVIEMVLDADRMETLIAKNDYDQSVLIEFHHLSYSKRMKIAREAFPFKYYGF